MPPAPSTKQPTYDVQERVLCFHGPMLYEAKVLEIRKPDDKKDLPEYKVHYKGWKNTWDEYVPSDRLRKLTDDNLRLQRELAESSKPKHKSSTAKPKTNSNSTTSSKPDDLLPPRGQKRGREMEIEKEEDYLKRQDVRLAIPDSLKAHLVDDWENVTKNQQLVPLPRSPNVVEILEKYKASVGQGKGKRQGSADQELLEEIVQGLRAYFDKALGTILLYRFERQQYLDVLKEWPGKAPSEIYGAEHLLRLCVSMPELLAQTNLDSQAMAKLRDHVEDFIRFLAKNPDFIVSQYESGESASA